MNLDKTQPVPAIRISVQRRPVRRRSPDKNRPYQQIIVDKTNAYWIDNPPTNFNQLANLLYKTKRRSKCDLLTYN